MEGCFDVKGRTDMIETTDLKGDIKGAYISTFKIEVPQDFAHF